jgi:hypothetical protein
MCFRSLSSKDKSYRLALEIIIGSSRVWVLFFTVSVIFIKFSICQNSKSKYIHIHKRYSYFYIKCAKRMFFVHEKVFYAETKVEAV